MPAAADGKDQHSGFAGYIRVRSTHINCLEQMQKVSLHYAGNAVRVFTKPVL